MDRHLRIAIADDELIVNMYLRRQLTDLGYTVVLEARSGQELLDGLSKVSADVVLTDINMSKLDGIDTAEMISVRYRIPIVLMSGSEIDVHVHRLGDSQAFGYLTKPFSASQLNAAIVMAMQRYKELHSVG